MDDLELRLDGGLEVRMARAAAPRCEPQPLESGLGEPRAAGTLGHREARTRAMLEEIDEAFIALDWEYRYVYANEARLPLARQVSARTARSHALRALRRRCRPPTWSGLSGRPWSSARPPSWSGTRR